MNKLNFNTWEKFQFAYIERKMRKKLSEGEKVALILKMKWRKVYEK